MKNPEEIKKRILEIEHEKSTLIHEFQTGSKEDELRFYCRLSEFTLRIEELNWVLES